MIKRILTAFAALAATLTVSAAEYDGKWIGCDYEGDVLKGSTVLPARYLRKEVTLDGKVKEATLRISGLGVYDTWINGEYITRDQELSPTVSEYRIRVYFNEFDVRKALKKGQNALAVSLGCGRYTTMREPGMKGFGVPRLWYRLDIVYTDGRTETVVSDES